VCHEVGTCRDGICPHPLKPDDTRCDDADAGTYYDVCTAGICTGQLLCAGTCVSWAKKVGVEETRERGLMRTREGTAWDAGAVSREAVTSEGDFAGVSFVAPQADRNLMFGLGSEDSSESFEDINFAVFLTSRGQVRRCCIVSSH